MTRTPFLLVAALFLGCQASAPNPLPPRPVSSAELLERFRWSSAESTAPLAPIHVLGESRRADDESVDAPTAAIELDDVLHSVEVHFPLILAAIEEVRAAESRVLQSQGAFDTRLDADSRFETEGYYENNRVDVKLEQPIELWGLTFNGGYRIGDGDFAVYDGKSKTNEDGEFRLGLTLPLLQGRAIDPRRVELWRARLAREQAEPQLVQKRLEATRKAADAYWKWLSAGRRREIAVRLLALAVDRMGQIEDAVNEGLLAPINLTENQRLIVDRRVALARAERGLEQSALALSLYWRDAEGQPSIPADSALPYEFPWPRAVEEVFLDDDEALALERRPELRALTLERSRLELDRSLADNGLMPKLDLGLYASQDVGNAVNPQDDKGPFEFAALLRFQLPLQRSSPRGKEREATAKLAKLERERQFLIDRVRNEIRDVRSALTQTWQRIGHARENVELANQLADAERLQLGAGQSDLLRVNLREQQAALAAAALVDVLDEYFRSLAEYRAALGIPYDEVALEARADEAR